MTYRILSKTNVKLKVGGVPRSSLYITYIIMIIIIIPILQQLPSYYHPFPMITA